LERGFEYSCVSRKGLGIEEFSYVSRKGLGIDGGGTSGAGDTIVDLGTRLGARDLVIGGPNGDSNWGALLPMRVFRDSVGERSSL
jgi:hypothetical protein